MSVKFYISPQGDDCNPGTFEKPFKSIGYAQSQVRECDELGKHPITIYLRAGTYYLEQPIIFTSEDSGTPDSPVTYTAYQSEKVIISGGALLALDWEPYASGIFQAKTTGDLEIDQLFVNGKRQHMARYPNFDSEIRPYNGFAADAFSPERASRWGDPTGGYIHAMHSAHWGGYHYRITGKNPDGTVAYEGGWQNNRQMGMHDEHRFVENIFEELDAPGEWFHQQKTQTLYYYPTEDVDIDTAKIEIARLQHLIEFNGTVENPVKHIQLNGITFQHAARTFMEPYERLLRSDWSIYRGGALFFNGSEECGITDCEFDQVGGNAIFVNDYNRDIVIKGTHIHGAGASAVCFVGKNDSVRNPLFERHENQAYSDIDKTPGPKTENFPRDCVVEDCLIHEIGVVEKQATGVEISMSRGITVRHCSIYDLGRAGINISEGTFGGHLIEFCDVFDTVLETDDHGSFNSWGRDRYWELQGAPPEDLPDLVLLDATEKTVIRNSRWRCDHGWDVDLDDGSSNYEIYNNLFLRGGLKLREGFHRKAYNNIGVNCTLHPHLWYENSGDSVTRNIWMAPYRPVAMMHWGEEVDRNLFVSESDRIAFLDQGCDTNGISGDPLFANPAIGDFSVGASSEFLAHGFKNFPMDAFGVQKPDLKAIARVPEFPVPILERKNSGNEKTVNEKWMGAEVKALSGEEFSAFGVKRADGGIHVLKVPQDSHAESAGLRQRDLIQRVNGAPVRSVKDLLQSTGNSPGKKFRIRIVRGYKNQFIEIEGK